jgi:hypothetical protein
LETLEGYLKPEALLVSGYYLETGNQRRRMLNKLTG